MVEVHQPLPHDEYAERAVLGAMLVDNRYASEVFSGVQSADFFRESHQKIAAAIDFLINRGESADPITVGALLKKRNELKFVGGYEYLNGLLDGVPQSINITEYIAVIRDRSSLRSLMGAAMGAVEQGAGGGDTESVLQGLHEELIRIADRKQQGGFHGTSEVVPETLGRIESIQNSGEGGGIGTGLMELDKMTSGFQKGDLVVVAARPSMGKTAIGLNIAAHMAVEEGKTIGFFSIEMSRAQIMMRLLALRASVNMKALMTGKPRLNSQEWQKLEMTAREYRQAELYIDDSASLNVVEMRSRSRRLKNERGLDIIFVDYLQLIKVGSDMLRRNDSRAQEVAVISASLKELAKELQIPVVALAQLNRSPEQRGSKKEGTKYQLSDLKESGAIEQDADVIIFLHREEHVNKDTEKKGIADLIIAKQRNGPTGQIELAYISEYTKFTNLDRGDDVYL